MYVLSINIWYIYVCVFVYIYFDTSPYVGLGWGMLWLTWAELKGLGLKGNPKP